MKVEKILALIFIFLPLLCYAQNIQELIDEVDIDNMMLTVNEFSGEQPTIVNGVEVTIINREHATNDIAADYLVERLENFENLVITTPTFSSTGKNVIATQIGQTNPDDIYVLGAHYDSVADYCADDNASGVAAILEIARILSNQCMDNTIVYAFWDMEEVGLLGSQNFVTAAASNGDNILGNLNLDMMGYDGNNDNKFDIDVRDIGGSIQMKDDVLDVLNTYSFNLDPIVVDPGTTASDHASFWFRDFSAVLVGESWETGDQTPFYHSSNDRAATLNEPYYKEIAKLVMGYMATKGGLVNIDNGVTVINQATELQSDQPTGTYQWFECDTNTAIAGATNRTYAPGDNDEYAVEVTLDGCTERSNCVTLQTLNSTTFSTEELTIYPNPTSVNLYIQNNTSQSLDYSLYDVSGKMIRFGKLTTGVNPLKVKELSQGIYFLKLKDQERSSIYKFIKQ